MSRSKAVLSKHVYQLWEKMIDIIIINLIIIII